MRILISVLLVSVTLAVPAQMEEWLSAGRDFIRENPNNPGCEGLSHLIAALEQFSTNACLAQDSGLSWAYVVKGLALENLGRTEEAQRAHDQALENPSDPKAYLIRGEEYTQMGAYDRAIRDFTTPTVRGLFFPFAL